MARKIKNTWPHGLVRKCIQKEALDYQGVRKIIQDITWTLDWEDYPTHTYEDLGYGKNKFKQLCRNYINEAEWDRVKGVIEKRKGKAFSSVALSLRGAQKESRSMGHCMQTLIISWTKKTVNVEVQYRSTEAILKFGADLTFIKWILEHFEIVPEFVRFRFANIYLSGVFFPTVCKFWDPVDFLNYLWDNDEKLFAGGTRFFLRSAYQKDQFFPYSPENQQHNFAWTNLDMGRIKMFLEEKHLRYNKPLPKQHHTRENYQVRRKK